MNVQADESKAESVKRRKPEIWLWCLLAVLCTLISIAWFAWPLDTEVSVADMNRADGEPRFKATTYATADLSGLNLVQRFSWYLRDYFQRAKRNPAAYSFPSSPVRLCMIEGLLSQCMEISGTKYLIAVEVLGGTVEFGCTNSLNGTQWVAAFETAVTNQNVFCYDQAAKSHFQDTLVLLREGKKLVKVVPRSKLSEYKRVGLIKGTISDGPGR